MSRPNLPTYFDDEVAKFHPVFEYAANKVLSIPTFLGKYKVEHHRTLGSGTIVDFAFENLSTGKIVLLCEIKRTINDVRSLRTRLQAKGYRTEASAEVETNYFLTSNLEILELFKYDPTRPRVAQQIVSPSPLHIGNLTSTNIDTFYSNLENSIEQVLLAAINDQGTYIEGLTNVQPLLNDALSDDKKWHQVLIPTSFEYIRGASDNIPSFKSKIRAANWQVAENYKGTPRQLIKVGKKVDFKSIFTDPIPAPNDLEAFDSTTLDDAYKSGKLTFDGSDLKAIIEELIAPTEPGLVQTDPELASILSILSKDSLGRELNNGEVILDPGAGCGNLLIEAINIFRNITTNQVWANERNLKFSEILSLRIGLRLAHQLSHTVQPVITQKDIVELVKSDLQNVKIILMNPPFIAGISSVRERNDLSYRIKEISGHDSQLNKGQIGLEAVFLELIWHLVPDGTVIASVLPHRSLNGLSSEVINFRNFLCNEFGLSHIAAYPRRGLFEDVIKHTIVAVGVKNAKIPNVKWLNLQLPLENINYSDLITGLNNNSNQPARGAELKILPNADLLASSSIGWNDNFDSAKDSKLWFESATKGMKKLLESAVRVYRGPSGNQGCSDLCMVKTNEINSKSAFKKIPNSWLYPAIKNAKLVEIHVNGLTAPNFSPVPPDSAYQGNSKDNRILTSIIFDYLKNVAPKLQKGKQPRMSADFKKVVRALKGNKLTPENSVLIPRAVRRFANIYITDEPTVISTNFFIASFSSMKEAEIAASWFSSVFSQIDMELKNLDQEGMRKLEGKQIKTLKCPDINNIPNKMISKFRKAFNSDEPLDYQALKPRTTDTLWAKILFPADPSNMLDQAFDNLYSLLLTRSRN